jgi:hypothetical protein
VKGSMDDNNDRWMKLCELAVVEQDSKKLIELTNEIARLLEERRRSSSDLSSNDLGDKPVSTEGAQA